MDLLTAALTAGRWNLPVHPLRPRMKSPMLKAWPDRATTNPETIRKWWASTPDANIGGAVPQGYILLDVDGAEGRASIAGRHLPHTITATTPREDTGHHYWLRLPEGVTATNRTILPGVDVKTAGGYAVLPPSIHPDTGGRYQWADLCAPGEVDVADAPVWLVELLTTKRDRDTAGIGRSDIDAAGLADEILEGVRNVTLFHHACRLRGRGADADTLLEVLLIANAERCRPALPEREVQTIAASAARYPAKVRVDDRLLNNPDLSDGAVLYGMLIAMTGGHPTQEELADLAGVKLTKSIRDWRDELRDAGLEDAARERPNRRYTLVSAEIIGGEMSSGARRLYAVIAQIAQATDDGVAQVGNARLAERIGATERTVIRRVKELEAEGVVRRNGALFDAALGRRPRCNRYRPLMESESLAALDLSGANRYCVSPSQEEEATVPESHSESHELNSDENAEPVLSVTYIEGQLESTQSPAAQGVSEHSQQPSTKSDGGAAAPSVVLDAPDEHTPDPFTLPKQYPPSEDHDGETIGAIARVVREHTGRQPDWTEVRVVLHTTGSASEAAKVLIDEYHARERERHQAHWTGGNDFDVQDDFIIPAHGPILRRAEVDGARGELDFEEAVLIAVADGLDALREAAS